MAPTKNADVRTRVASRNVDLVFLEAEPKTARAAVENKTIMTAHGKARWNRYGDLIAYCNHMHNHRPDCIAAAIVIVNCSPAYENPDAFARGLLRPKFDMAKVVKDTVKIFADVPLRTSPDEPNDQPEALAVIVVDYDGKNPAKLVTGDLFLQPEKSHSLREAYREDLPPVSAALRHGSVSQCGGVLCRLGEDVFPRRCVLTCTALNSRFVLFASRDTAISK